MNRLSRVLLVPAASRRWRASLPSGGAGAGRRSGHAQVRAARTRAGA